MFNVHTVIQIEIHKSVDLILPNIVYILGLICTQTQNRDSSQHFISSQSNNLRHDRLTIEV